MVYFSSSFMCVRHQILEVLCSKVALSKNTLVTISIKLETPGTMCTKNESAAMTAML